MATFGEAWEALRAGKKVRHYSFDQVEGSPSFLVMAPGRTVEASFTPMVDHLGLGTPFRTRDHVDAIFNFGTDEPLEVQVGYEIDLHLGIAALQGWEILD